jgi:hypothetical protein
LRLLIAPADVQQPVVTGGFDDETVHWLDLESGQLLQTFRGHKGRVHASLFRVLGTNRDMDDLLQESFLQVFQSLRGWRAEASRLVFIWQNLTWDNRTARCRSHGNRAPLHSSVLNLRGTEPD